MNPVACPSPMRRPLRRLAMTGVMLTMVTCAMPTVAAAQPPTSQPTPGARSHRYRPTTPFVRDQQTGQRRLPTETEVAQLVESLATLTQRPDTLPEVQAGSGVAVDLQAGFNGVFLGRASEDGSIETRCVFTFQEGIDFLGLVPVVE